MYGRPYFILLADAVNLKFIVIYTIYVPLYFSCCFLRLWLTKWQFSLQKEKNRKK
jgi:hypothetical protein